MRRPCEQTSKTVLSQPAPVGATRTGASSGNWPSTSDRARVASTEISAVQTSGMAQDSTTLGHVRAAFLKICEYEAYRRITLEREDAILVAVDAHASRVL